MFINASISFGLFSFKEFVLIESEKVKNKFMNIFILRVDS